MSRRIGVTGNRPLGSSKPSREPWPPATVRKARAARRDEVLADPPGFAVGGDLAQAHVGRPASTRAGRAGACREPLHEGRDEPGIQGLEVLQEPTAHPGRARIPVGEQVPLPERIEDLARVVVGPGPPRPLLDEHQRFDELRADGVETRAEVGVRRADLLPQLAAGPLEGVAPLVQQVLQAQEQLEILRGVLPPARAALAGGEQSAARSPSTAGRGA